MADQRRWVIDTSAYTHLCRAGHASLLQQLAPRGVVLVPTEVNAEIENGRTGYPGIRSVAAVDWAELAVLTEAEEWTKLLVKAELGGGPFEHLGECEVIACAHHRNFIAVLDEREAITQADALGVHSVDTLWIVIEAYKTIFDCDRSRAAQVVDDLLATGMYLPISDGKSLFTWAYQEELLP
jgi:predicted nucleic acid-binding protein